MTLEPDNVLTDFTASGDLTRLTAALAGRYRVDRELGRGGMATVYLAHDLKHGREVAIKVLHPDLGAALGGERFLSEIRTTARLQHPHILALLDSGASDGLLYYVMPLVTGETLRHRLGRERQISVPEAVRIGREVASALDYAHRQGVIHRDIKPENILLHDGQAQVADFGIALAVQSAGGQRLTQTGLSLGTPQYMSPEQASGERTIDARGDIYALGAVTYEMLTGEPPFTGPTIQAIVARLMAEEPRPLVVQRKSIPDHVEAAVLRALEKVPADRFASAAEFASALDVASATATRTAGTRAGKRPSRSLTLALGVLAAGGIAAAAWGWLRPVPLPNVVRYRITIDSVPAVKDWSGEIAIAPDGNVIVRSGGANATLLVRRRNELAFSPLPGTEGAWGPFFSPDGTQIGYYSSGSLLAVPLAGGPPVTIADSLPTPVAVTWGSDGYLYRSLTKDGVELIGRSKPGTDAALEVVTTVDTLAGELTHLNAEVLPDGKSLFFQVGFRDGKRVIAIGDIATRRHTLLLEGTRGRYLPSGHLLYATADGKLWAIAFDLTSRTTSGTPVQIGDRIPNTMVGPVDFAVSASGTLVYAVEDPGARRELTWVTRVGSRQPFDSTWKGEFTSPTLSPDGSRIAVSLRDGNRTDIWVRSLTGGSPTKITSEQHRTNVEPAWSPDGQWVSYLASTGSAANVGDAWRQRFDGGGRAERIVQSRRPLSEQSWTPRGDALIVRTTTATSGSGDILLMRLGGDSVGTALIASARAEYSPAVSPDGKWLAYVSNETGRFEVYVTPFATPGSAKWAVSPNGGSTPRWSPRGDELFYLDLHSSLVAAAVNTAPSFAITNTRVLFSVADFNHTSMSRRNYDVSPDGQRFLMVQRADGAKRGEVVVVENWVVEIRRKMRQP